MRRAFYRATMAFFAWSALCGTVSLILRIAGTANPPSGLFDREDIHAWVVAAIAVDYPVGALLLVALELGRSRRRK